MQLWEGMSVLLESIHSTLCHILLAKKNMCYLAVLIHDFSLKNKLYLVYRLLLVRLMTWFVSFFSSVSTFHTVAEKEKSILLKFVLRDGYRTEISFRSEQFLLVSNALLPSVFPHSKHSWKSSAEMLLCVFCRTFSYMLHVAKIGSFHETSVVLGT